MTEKEERKPTELRICLNRIKDSLHVENVLRKTVYFIASAHADADTVEHQDLEACLREAAGKGHIIFTGHIVSVSHDDESPGVFRRAEQQTSDEIAFI